MGEGGQGDAEACVVDKIFQLVWEVKVWIRIPFACNIIVFALIDMKVYSAVLYIQSLISISRVDVHGTEWVVCTVYPKKLSDDRQAGH